MLYHSCKGECSRVTTIYRLMIMMMLCIQFRFGGKSSSAFRRFTKCENGTRHIFEQKITTIDTSWFSPPFVITFISENQRQRATGWLCHSELKSVHIFLTSKPGKRPRLRFRRLFFPRKSVMPMFRLRASVSFCQWSFGRETNVENDACRS